MANYQSSHTGATIDDAVGKVANSGVTQADLTKLSDVTATAAQLDETKTLSSTYHPLGGSSTQDFIAQNLTVHNTFLTKDSQNVQLGDAIITLNAEETGTPTENAGIEVERGTSTNVILRWNETSDRWEFTNNGTTYYNIPISTEYATYVSSDFTHDDLSGVTANEHIDWTADQDSTNIHSGNYTNTTYSVVSTSADGLAPTLPASHGGKFLRGDGTWVVPPDTDTVYTHPTTAGNKHIPTGGSSGQFLGYSASGTAQWVANPNTDTVDMGDGFRLVDIDSNVAVTENEYVKIKTSNSGSHGFGAITGTGTSIDPYILTLNTPNTTYTSSSFDHDSLTNTHNLTTDIDHDALTGFVADEHIDWTTDQGSTNIHSGNYTNTSQATEFYIRDSVPTTYTIGHGKYIKFTSSGSNSPAQPTLSGSGTNASPYTLLTQYRTYATATTSSGGLMSSGDKTKLDGIETGATNVTNNNQLTNGANYISGITGQVIGSLSNVDNSAPSNNQILKYNTGSSTWIVADNNPTMGNISTLSDVTVTSPSDAQVLQWQDATSRWVNATLSLSYLPLAGGTLTGGIQRNAHGTGHFVGSYNNVGANSDKSNPIYTIGSSYNPTDSALSNMYGIGYAHGNFWGSGSGKPGGWGLYAAADGDIRCLLEASSGVIWALSSMKVGSSTVLHTGNYSSYANFGSTALTAGSGTFSGVLTNTGGSKITVQNAVDGGNSRGIFMWNDTDTNWGIYMGQSGASKSLSGGTAVAGDGFTAHALRFRVAAGATQGFVWENHNEDLLMSIRGSDGNMFLSGNTTLSGTVRCDGYGSNYVFGSRSSGSGNTYTNWIAGFFSNQSGDAVVMGTGYKGASIGAHSNALNAWAKLWIQPNGSDLDLSDGALTLSSGTATFGGNINQTSSAGSTTTGHAGKFESTQSANGNGAPFCFQSSRGNHSWGIVARFATNNSGDSDRPSIQFSCAQTSTRWNVGFSSNDNNFNIVQDMGNVQSDISSGGWGTKRFTIDTSGSIGIGTSSPSSKLDVYASSGDASFSLKTASQHLRFDQNSIRSITNTALSFTINGGWTHSFKLQTNGEFTATGDIIAYYSDARLKDFHGVIENPLDKVMKLNGYYFTENERAKELGLENDRMQVGVSAQEVKEVLPELIKSAPLNEANGTDYMTINYGKLTPLLIEAIKELKNELNKLKQEMN